MMTSSSSDQLLERIGARVRQRRNELGLSLKSLAERADMSSRFLSDVEAGRGNIAIGRLANLAAALDTSLVSLIRPLASGNLREAVEEQVAACSEDELRRLLSFMDVARGKRAPRTVALLGLRGAGKSTVGSALASRLDLPFVELARRVEERAQMPLGDLFSLHGEGYYRRLEKQCLTKLLGAGEPCVVALPGGIVEDPGAFDLILTSCYTVWLRARDEDHLQRVFAQGDTRPMAGREDAMADLRALIARRTPLYRRADHIVDTSGIAVDDVVSSVVAALDSSKLRSLGAGKDDKPNRARRRRP